MPTVGDKSLLSERTEVSTVPLISTPRMEAPRSSSLPLSVPEGFLLLF